MSRRRRRRFDKRAIAFDLARTDPRESREPDELVTITGQRIDLRRPWFIPTNTHTKGPK